MTNDVERALLVEELANELRAYRHTHIGDIAFAEHVLAIPRIYDALTPTEIDHCGIVQMSDEIDHRQDGWQPIETAPKDGTVILAKNECMGQPVEARWGDYYPSYGGPPKVDWTVWRDLDEYPCIPRGALLVPTHWRELPAPAQPSSEVSHD